MTRHLGKQNVANAVTLKYFDRDVPIVLECDSSSIGISECLTSEWSPGHLHITGIDGHSEAVLEY